MTITKTLKTKLVLGILAAAASLTLAVGGTLMLFTARSDTATNVVTLGNAKIALQEATTTTEDYYDGTTDENGNKNVSPLGDYTTVDDDFTGITFKNNAVPGDAFAKAPRVWNNGSVPVYVKVEGALKITPPTTNANWDALEDLINTDYNSIFGTYFDKVVLGYDPANWSGTPITVTPGTKIEDGKTVGDGTITVKGTWYYTKDGSRDATTGAYTYGTLKELPVGTNGGFSVTAPIFKGIQLPTTIPNAFKDFNFSFDLTAYAVQSENNGPAEDLTGLAALESVFPAGDAYGTWDYQPPAPAAE
jgi:hypothetical protein